jgi:hypothetical protein
VYCVVHTTRAEQGLGPFNFKLKFNLKLEGTELGFTAFKLPWAPLGWRALEAHTASVFIKYATPDLPGYILLVVDLNCA